jgi:hypothetical protein
MLSQVLIDHNYTLYVIVSASAEALQADDNASARSRCKVLQIYICVNTVTCDGHSLCLVQHTAERHS